MIVAAVVCAMGAAARVQQGDTISLRRLADRGDSAALIAEVRLHPVAARELLSEWLREAAGAPARSDSIVTLARRVANAYATAWDDSFPVTNLQRFARMTVAQRA